MKTKTEVLEARILTQIRVSYGQTINRGNYEAERVELSITIPVESTSTVDLLQHEQKLFETIKRRVEKHTSKSFD